MGVRSGDGFTVFIENLPCNLDKFGLKGIFQRVGAVSDSYVPSKLGRSNKRFRFVRFWKEIDAINCVSRINGIMVRGYRVRVFRAIFGKGSKGANDEDESEQALKMLTRKRWKSKSLQASHGICNQKDQHVVAKIGGGTNESFVEWLRRSLICTSSVTWDLEDLSQALSKVGCSRVRALTKRKFILTYQSSVKRDEALKNEELLSNWFHEVKIWDIYETCNSRRLWIDVFGIPPHGWSLDNFEKIASFWGKLICLETPIEDTVSFDSMRILIETASFQEVGGHIILQIRDADYRIWVKEASCSININPMFIAPESCAHKSASVREKASRLSVTHDEVAALLDDANKVVNSKGVSPDASSPTKARSFNHGLDDPVNLGDELALNVDVEQSCWSRVANVEQEQSRLEDKESTGFQNDSNSFKKDVSLIKSSGPNSNFHL